MLALLILLLIILIWAMKNQSGYSNPYMPFFNGKEFIDDDLSK